MESVHDEWRAVTWWFAVSWYQGHESDGVKLLVVSEAGLWSSVWYCVWIVLCSGYVLVCM